MVQAIGRYLQMTDRPLVFEDFSDKIGDAFVIGEEGVPAIALRLKEAKLLNPNWGLPGVRPPFSLTFLAADPRVLMQRLYRLEHQRLGAVTIFLVPAAKDDTGVTYHATFN